MIGDDDCFIGLLYHCARKLGQEVYIALTKADTGRGIIAGVCVAFIAIIADRMINAWAARRKREYGLE